MSPLYIYFLAAFLGPTGSYTAVRLIQVALGTVAVGFILICAREWFGRRAGWIAAVLAAGTGLFTFYEALILQTSIDVFLTSAALLCFTLALTRDNLRWMIATGAIFGLQALNRPNIALAAAGLVLVMLAARRWRPALVLTAGIIIGMSPAAIRNVVVAHEFSLVSSHGGLNFYIGNHEGATGFYETVPGVTPNIKGQQEDVRRVASAALGRSVTDSEASDYFVNLSLSWMTSHPGDAAWLLARKLGWTFHAQHIALPYSYPFYQYDAPTWLRFFPVGPWLLIPLGLVGLLFGAPRTPHRAPAPGTLAPAHPRTPYLLWCAFVPCYSAAVALFFIAERYRLPLLVPLVVGAGGAIDYAWRLVSARQFRALVAPVVVALIIGALANAPSAVSDGRWEEGLRVAQRLVQLGRFDEAEAWVATLESNAPRPGMAHAGLGKQLMLIDQPARALPHLQKAVELDRGATAEDWLRVGRLAAEVGAPAAGEPYFRQAVALAPNDAGARQQYGLNLLVLDRFDDAARELGEAVRLDPKNAASLSHLAYAEAKLGRIPEARAHLAAALAIDPADPMAQQLAAVLR
ncbi:MAG: glycosyltransferase family 39 protein [Acidobacteria bacterium]|nr:glycosyltransferase family 39 protein [Acidobacteriota bacterium]